MPASPSFSPEADVWLGEGRAGAYSSVSPWQEGSSAVAAYRVLPGRSWPIP